ncbi:MAG: carboxypeptidase-like regulatory domain-containing protein [Chitinophagaceae bacterium]|nr:carboxypeptidase-like regulatory domain-containing protein [Chitinophagaceae bacterium]
MTNNIHTFTAFDIEKYHRGQLSAKEMHAMEKAALEDPFLADALEGFAVPGANVMADLADLKNRLGNRLAEEEEKKVVPLKGARKPFPWFRAAAAVVIIAGGALLANQFLFNKKNEQLAVNEVKQDKPESTSSTPADTGTLNSNTAENKSTEKSDNLPPSTAAADRRNDGVNNPGDDKSVVSGKENVTINTEEVVADVKTKSSASNGDLPKISGEINQPAERTEAKVANKNPGNNTQPVIGGADKDLARNNELKKTAPSSPVTDREKAKLLTDTETATANQSDRNVSAARKMEDQAYYNQRANVFRGRVTDANNVGVPFANVTNVEDKVGTYTDAYGNFNLTSPDSTLTVQVRSIGFENRQVQLKNTLPTNQVVMHDDRRNISEVVISNQKPAEATARSRDANKKLEEPEPVVGWSNYNTYAANNLEIPEEIRSKQNSGGAVQVSFEVDKYGDPVNIRVEKSLCSKCDQEAIRLIKDGPKWKRAAKKNGRTTVTINF